MRTRSSSLLEKYFIYVGIIAIIIVGLFGVIMIYKNYSKKIDDSRKKQNEIKDQERAHKQELENIQRQIAQNQKLYDQKIKQMGAEKEKFEKKKLELKKYESYIPPYYMKSLLRKKMLNEATLFNIDVLSYSAKKIDEQKFNSLSFFPLQFTMELIGEYGAIKRFLWYLDHDIYINDMEDSDKKWKFITNISLKDGLTIINPNENLANKSNVPRGPVPAGQRVSHNNQQPKGMNGLELNDFINIKEGLLKDNKLHIRLKINTYFRNAKNG